MGNNNITLKNQELQKLFSIDKNFENYYFNNENNYRKEFIIIEEQESTSLDCLNCNYLCKTKNQEKHNKKVNNWLIHLKKQCIDLKNQTIWTDSITESAKNFSYKISFENYLPYIYYEDYKADIFNYEDRKPNPNQVNFHEIDEKEQINFVSLNSPIIEFTSQKKIKATKTYANYEVKIFKQLSYKSNFENEKNLLCDSTIDLKRQLFLKNNTLISQNKLNESIDYTRNPIKNDSNQYKYLNHYKSITQLIENNIKQQKHPLTICKEIFLKQIYDNHSNLNDSDLFYNVQQFIRVFSETIIIFYALDNYRNFIKNYFYFTKENIIGFVTSLIFNEKNLYEILLQNQINNDFEFEKRIKENVLNCKAWTPENFGVSAKFSLTLNTIQSLKKRSKKSCVIGENKKKGFNSPKINNKKRSKSQEEIKKKVFIYKKSENIVNEEKDEVVELKKTFVEKEKKIGKPFELAINNLKKITSVTSPIHKIKIIYKTYLLINENIKSFYFKYGIKYNGIIESDEILAIFIYLCSKCEIENLYAECSLIEKFITDQVANSLTGYYLITLKSALLCLSDGDFLKKECGIH